MKVFIFLSLLVAVCFGSLRNEMHSGTTVHRFSGSENELKELSSLSLKLQLDIWKVDYQNNYIDIAIPEEHKALFSSYSSSIIHSDLQESINSQFDDILKNSEYDYSKSLPLDDFFKTWQTYDAYVSFWQDLASKYSFLLSLTTIGKTYLGNDIYAFQFKGNSPNTTKPGIYYNGCQHAREWISPATVTYIVWKLATNYGLNPTITSMIDNIDFTIAPLVNIDGFKYTWDSNRMWRKNRQPNSGSTCVGTDTNRNWAYKWNQGGSSSNPCSDTFMGASPFSAPEPKLLSDDIKRVGNVELYVDFHSYGAYYLTPWGWTSAYPANYDAQLKVANNAAAAIKSVNGITFKTGSSYRLLYQTSGGSNDWAYGDGGVSYAYTVELRGNSFIIDSSNIIPSGEEIFASVITNAQDLLQPKN